MFHLSLQQTGPLVITTSPTQPLTDSTTRLTYLHVHDSQARSLTTVPSPFSLCYSLTLPQSTHLHPLHTQTHHLHAVYESTVRTSKRLRTRDKQVTTCLHRQEHVSKGPLSSHGKRPKHFPHQTQPNVFPHKGPHLSAHPPQSGGQPDHLFLIPLIVVKRSVRRQNP
jgi:hypothetical protein